jgi:hypothetical protein
MENLALSVLCYNNVVSFQFLGNYSFDMYHLIRCEKKMYHSAAASSKLFSL